MESGKVAAWRRRMKTSPEEPKKWEPTREAYDKYLARLDPDRDRAGERHEKIRENLHTFFAVRRCPNADELTDITLDRVIRDVGEKGREVSNVVAFCFGVAKNVHRESLRADKARNLVSTEEASLEQKITTPSIEEQQKAEDEKEATWHRREARVKATRHCLKQMPPQDREIFQRYYRGEKEGENKKERQVMAEELGIKIEALRQMAWKLRKKFIECIERYLRSLQPGETPGLS
jgi:RNA polymerase sigma factor (sigma-70 family)